MYEINTEKEIKFTCGCHVLWDSNYIILLSCCLLCNVRWNKQGNIFISNTSKVGFLYYLEIEKNYIKMWYTFQFHNQISLKISII